ncbi:MAG: Asp-tRNA(Asn)/Glu-tRNA(Gln) amidotransferase GatCAB subunit C [Hoeflea sp.]|uniref:molybdopterin-dependent oxidoreductase n=1 Tax=Hoeflea sp. TaxID=1940281 RepID=UPI000C0DB90F|nr:molybdopterin-dependent oxidoreductase [Hoeflea sp.]PHR25395.1 MAG: Asp-tRNA(Asn)/Glu-tRNA(Gln) amidotransferase GatCAB subunit C [Hoeflea sp.]
MKRHTPTSGERPDTLTASHWGSYRVTYENGLPSRLTGFEADADPSPIGDSMLDTLGGPCRVSAPMVRKGWRDGDRALRGRDDFIEVSWDEALNLVAGELDRVRTDHGHEAIYAGSYGWASAGRFHHAQSQLRRFMNLFGGCTVSKDSYSYAAAEVILPHIAGSMSKLLQEHTSWKAVTEGAKLVVAFGGVALRNAQMNPGGTGSHSQRADMLAARQAGVEFVNISPAAGDAIAELGADWLPIRPNTDVALMLALAHTIVSEGRHDKAFLASHCTGFERFLPYLMGTSGSMSKTAGWAEEITGIPADTIITLARRMASQPTMINASWSLTRQQNGEQAYWMLVVLAAILGGIGKKGTGFGLGFGAVNSVGSHRAHLPVAALPTGRNPVDSFIPVARIADMLLNPGAPFEYNGQKLHYPDIKLVYWAGGNPFHHHQDLNRLRKAWEQIETVVVHEPFWTPLARRADIVLPATVGLERNDLAASPRDNFLIASQRAAKPFGQARNDHAIFADLAGRLHPSNSNHTGFTDTFTEGRDEVEWLRELYEETRKRGVAGGHVLPDYETFLETGFCQLVPEDEPTTMLQAFGDDPVANPLLTPSGRIEIFSETIESFGLPGHPAWIEPDEWLGAPLSKTYPLHLISHQPERRLHSQLDHGAHSRAGKLRDREPCRMNPQDALARSIGDGDMVRLYNGRGSCISAAILDQSVRPGVVMIATGAWYDPDWDTDPDCCKHGNPNTLTADLPTSILAQGPSAQTCLIDIERLATKAPTVTAFTPPRVIDTNAEFEA